MRQINTLVQFHDRTIGHPDRAKSGEDLPAGDEALWQAIADNHACNIQLWNEEDQARRPDVPAECIVISKRRIDRLNQQRNDAIEAIDDALITLLAECHALPDARLHSETPGAMIDRLSILALKIFHMHKQLERNDVDAVHLARCSEKLHRLRVQRRELAGCLRELLDEVRAGSACFHAYRQFKMYNDPALNPWLTSQASAQSSRPASAAPGRLHTPPA